MLQLPQDERPCSVPISRAIISMLIVAMPPALAVASNDNALPVWAYVVFGVASEVILILLGALGWVWRRGRAKEDEHIGNTLTAIDKKLDMVIADQSATTARVAALEGTCKAARKAGVHGEAAG